MLFIRWTHSIWLVAFSCSVIPSCAFICLVSCLYISSADRSTSSRWSFNVSLISMAVYSAPLLVRRYCNRRWPQIPICGLSGTSILGSRQSPLLSICAAHVFKRWFHMHFLLCFVADFILRRKCYHFKCVDKTKNAQRTVDPLGFSINMKCLWYKQKIRTHFLSGKSSDFSYMVETGGLEPSTSCVWSMRSNQLS